jgi:hypothetical protein
MVYSNRKKQTYTKAITVTLLIVGIAAGTIAAQGTISAYAREKEPLKKPYKTTATIHHDDDVPVVPCGLPCTDWYKAGTDLPPPPPPPPKKDAGH